MIQKMEAINQMEHICCNCNETMSFADFQRGKMCCDTPDLHEHQKCIVCEEHCDDGGFIGAYYYCEKHYDVEEEDTSEEWFDLKYPNATCHRCDTKLTGATVVYCGGGGGACETWYCADCHDEGTDDCEVCKAVTEK